MNNKIILVVDDDPEVRLALQIRLGMKEYVTIFAADGAKAIAAVEKFSPDLILLDIGLPSTDGFGVLAWLEEQTNPTPVIVISGRNMVPTRERAMRAGAKAYLQKPVDNQHILDTIRRVIGQEEEAKP
jgi:DNA-binding response OmpR family regulator